MLGIKTSLPEKTLTDVPFFGQLSYEQMPSSVISNLCFSQPFYKGEAVFALNGPAHLQKNFTGAMRSGKMMYFGDYFVDLQGTLDCGVPPASFCGYDGQSDLLAALLVSPYHYVVEIPASPSEAKIPWCLRGAFLLNLTMAMGQAAATHPALTPVQRTESAMTCFVLIDLLQMLANERAAAAGARKGSFFLHATTCRNQQELCGFVMLACLNIPKGYQYRPHKCTELHLEQWFAHIRSQYISSQVSVRDFLYGSSKKVQAYFQAAKHVKGEPPLPLRESDRPITHEDF
jgi:hypothetical protein